MLELKDGFVLYHGGYCEVKEPDLAKCAKRKDFGCACYGICLYGVELLLCYSFVIGSWQ